MTAARQAVFQLESTAGALDGLDDLSRGSIHLWHIEIDPEDPGFDYRTAALSNDERLRAAAISSDSARRRYVSTRQYLRSVLAHYLRISPSAVSFVVGEYGKPRLADKPPDLGLVFNATHSSNHIAIALALDARLGVDMESWRTLQRPSSLAARFLAASEFDYWRRLPEASQGPELFRLWTIKEAFCKAVGRGIALGLRDCVFDWSSPKPHLVSWPGAAHPTLNHWSVHEMTGLSGVSGAIVCDRLTTQVRCFPTGASSSKSVA